MRLLVSTFRESWRDVGALAYQLVHVIRTTALTGSWKRAQPERLSPSARPCSRYARSVPGHQKTAINDTFMAASPRNNRSKPLQTSRSRANATLTKQIQRLRGDLG